MQTFFIKESSKTNRIRLMFSKVEEKTIDNKSILILPINSNTKITKRKIKRIITYLKKKNIKRVVLSKYLNSMEIIKKELIENNIKIIDGTFNFKMLLNEVLEYICKIGKTSMEKLKISIITNDTNIMNKQIIIELASIIKSLSIVTNKQKEFKNIEEYLYNEMGIIIKLLHNIDKTSNIIINLDISTNELKQYNIPYKSIIININGNIKINSKRFNGININSYNIEMPNKYKIQDFEDKLLYESITIDKEYNLVKKQIKEDKIQIKNLIGEKGIINDKEFIIFS